MEVCPLGSGGALVSRGVCGVRAEHFRGLVQGLLQVCGVLGVTKACGSRVLKNLLYVRFELGRVSDIALSYPTYHCCGL